MYRRTHTLYRKLIISSLIDLVLTSNRNIIISCGVGDPFLPQQVRYHCPVYGILNVSKPKSVSYVRNIWSYDRGNYDKLREKASSVNWNDDINVCANNITDTILELSKQCIPNKVIRFRSSDPPWITNSLKKDMLEFENGFIGKLNKPMILIY